jgi:hypothetical protein
MTLKPVSVVCFSVLEVALYFTLVSGSSDAPDYSVSALELAKKKGMPIV